MKPTFLCRMNIFLQYVMAVRPAVGKETWEASGRNGRLSAPRTTMRARHVAAAYWRSLVTAKGLIVGLRHQ